MYIALHIRYLKPLPFPIQKIHRVVGVLQLSWPALHASLLSEDLQVSILQNLQSHSQWHDFPQGTAASSRVDAIRPSTVPVRGRLGDRENEAVAPFEFVQLFHHDLCLNVKAHSITYEVIKQRRHITGMIILKIR